MLNGKNTDVSVLAGKMLDLNFISQTAIYMHFGCHRETGESRGYTEVGAGIIRNRHRPTIH